MEKDANLDVLLRIRGQMELEIQELQYDLAGKNRVLQSLNETIDLLLLQQGANPEEAVRTAESHVLDDMAAMRKGAEEFIREKGKGFNSTYCDAVRSTVNRIISELSVAFKEQKQ